MIFCNTMLASNFICCGMRSCPILLGGKMEWTADFSLCHQPQKIIFCWVWWFTPLIPAIEEMEIGRVTASPCKSQSVSPCKSQSVNACKSQSVDPCKSQLAYTNVSGAHAKVSQWSPCKSHSVSLCKRHSVSPCKSQSGSPCKSQWSP
jgi:hypothetical protein